LMPETRQADPPSGQAKATEQPEAA